MAYPNDPPAPPTLALKSGESINTGLVAWWPLTDGSGSTATDISTGGNDVGFSVAGWEVESIGNCLDAVATSSNTATTLNHPSADVSYSLWIKGDTSNLVGLVDGRSTLGGLNGTRVDISSRKAKLVVDSSAGFLNTASSTTEVAPISGATWVHVACTWDGVNAKVYVNGTLETTVAHGGTLSSLESYDINTPSSGDLSVQNVRIWNVALTAQQVSDIYATPWLGSNYEETGNTYFFPAHFGGRL